MSFVFILILALGISEIAIGLFFIKKAKTESSTSDVVQDSTLKPKNHSALIGYIICGSGLMFLVTGIILQYTGMLEQL